MNKEEGLIVKVRGNYTRFFYRQKEKPLSAALQDWVEVQGSVGKAVITVNDLTCYEKKWGLLVKVNGQEPEGIHNGYKSPREIERDLARVVPGYVNGAAIWQEKPEEEYDD